MEGSQDQARCLLVVLARRTTPVRVSYVDARSLSVTLRPFSSGILIRTACSVVP